MVNVALALSFIAFLAVVMRMVTAKSKVAISDYRASIIQKFDEAENLLNAAKALLFKVIEDQASIAVQAEKILELAHAEIRAILEKNRHEIHEMKVSYAVLLEQQSKAFGQQLQKKLILMMWDDIYLNVRNFTSKQPSSEVISFIENRLTFNSHYTQDE